MRRLKDRTFAQLLKGFFNMKLEEIGKIEKLFIDSKEKKIFVEARLRGEESPVSVEILRYHIRGEELVIEDIRASKEWIEGVFEHFLKG